MKSVIFLYLFFKELNFNNSFLKEFFFKRTFKYINILEVDVEVLMPCMI